MEPRINGHEYPPPLVTLEKSATPNKAYLGTNVERERVETASGMPLLACPSIIRRFETDSSARPPLTIENSSTRIIKVPREP